MSTILKPYARLDLYGMRDFLGVVQCPSDDISWNLIPLWGRPDSYITGLVPDPLNQHMIQEPFFVPIEAGTAAWSLTGSGPIWDQYSIQSVAGIHGLYQTAGDAGVISSAVTTFSHLLDNQGGFRLIMYRGAPVDPTATVTSATQNLYIYLSYGATTGTRLRVAIEAGNPIRLDGSTDGVIWNPVATANGLGESETYLNSRNRYITIDVIPLFDCSWYPGLPDSASASDKSPDTLYVVIGNGDAVLQWSQDNGTFPAGNICIYATGGQWSCEYHDRWYQPTFEVGLPPQIRPYVLTTEPQSFLGGYLPYDAAWVLEPVLPPGTSGNQVGALLTYTAPASMIDTSTGKSSGTVALTSANLYYPPVFCNSRNSPSIMSFEQDRLIGFQESHPFSQQNMMRRNWMRVTLSNNDLALSPNASGDITQNGMPLSVTAAQLWRGFSNNEGYNDIGIGMTGVVSNDDSGNAGLHWHTEGAQHFLTMEFTDYIATDIPCEWLREMDNQCHYYAIRQCGYRMGYTDQRMQGFPYCGRNSPCSHYHLPYGTLYDPAMRPHPEQSVISFMMLIRSLSGEYDYATGQVCPMYMFEDRYGNLQYYPAPIGLVQWWMQGLQVILDKVYSGVPELLDGNPTLNEIVNTLDCSVNFSNVRTQILYEGRQPTDGAFVTAWYKNLLLDGSAYSNQFAPGYVGRTKSYINISKLISSPQVATMMRDLAAVQMSIPSVSSWFMAHAQSDIFPLENIIGINDFPTQGSYGNVGYWPTNNVIRYGQDGQKLTMQSNLECRLLGQAG